MEHRIEIIMDHRLGQVDSSNLILPIIIGILLRHELYLVCSLSLSLSLSLSHTHNGKYTIMHFFIRIRLFTELIIISLCLSIAFVQEIMGSSGSKSSGSGNAKTGGDWRHQVYFDPEADESHGVDYRINDDELREKLSGLVDAQEDILEVYVYKCPLSDWQLTDLILHHMFVVFETACWWWSVEKNTEGLTIQRSKHIDYVKRKYRRGDRNKPIELMNSDKGRYSIDELIRWMYRENELNNEYNVYTSNCKHFAKAVFNHVARTKTM